jgi:hypothetical protein
MLLKNICWPMQVPKLKEGYPTAIAVDTKQYERQQRSAIITHSHSLSFTTTLAVVGW